jgi:N-acetylmuramoyl-L-alanine amidase
VLALWLACIAPPPPPAEPEVAAEPLPSPSWPEISQLARSAPLSPLGWRRPKVLLDAGHGAENNAGNVGVRCQSEADEMRRLTDEMLERLSDDALNVATTRPNEALVSYTWRVDHANSWSDLLISLHSDVRSVGRAELDPTTGCRSVDDAHGFSVLWSDEGPPRLVQRRQALARVLGAQLLSSGFVAYDGEDYGVYESDSEVAGVFVDRHEPDQRIRLLRRPTVPSVIIETHHALDADEVERWNEEETLEAFASALLAGVIEFVMEGG